MWTSHKAWLLLLWLGDLKSIWEEFPKQIGHRHGVKINHLLREKKFLQITNYLKNCNGNLKYHRTALIFKICLGYGVGTCTNVNKNRVIV